MSPVAATTCSCPAATATSIPCRIEAIQAEHEYGTTTPVVPRMDSPPSMPRRGFQVRRASSSPPSTPISTITSASPTASRIMRRGTGLMAGSPTGTGRPGSVTVPTPGPARNSTPEPRAPYRTVARTSAPWVTSGSSPASLTTPAMAAPCSRRSTASAKAGRFPPGRSIVTGSGNVPVRRAV